MLITSYSQFEDELLVAIVAVADVHPLGQVDVLAVAPTLLPNVKHQWVSAAVKSYEDSGLVYNVSSGISPRGIRLMITGAGRRLAEALDDAKAFRVA
jgi:hypothetical protein